jgi:hypothetical protein
MRKCMRPDASDSMYVWRQCMHGPGSRVGQAEWRVASSSPPAAAVTTDRQTHRQTEREREMNLNPGDGRLQHDSDTATVTGTIM